MISKILSYLSRRFPQQLVVTIEEYKELREEMGKYNQIAQGVIELNSRMVLLEKQVKELNTRQGIINMPKGSFTLER
jgi:hypothetical protein